MSAVKIIRLKRCPLCALKASVRIRTKPDCVATTLYAIGCDSCGIYVKSSNILTAAKRWNSRKIVDAEDVFVAVNGVWIRKEKQSEEN